MTNSVAYRIGIGGLFAGLVMGVWGVVMRDAPAPQTVSPEAVSSIGHLQPIQGMKPLDEVIDLWQRRSDDNPLDYLSRTQLGVALASEARETAALAGYERAETVLRDALELNPSYPPARLALAQALSSQHQFKPARDIAEALHDEDQSSLAALALIGDTSFELGDYDRAALIYHQLAALERSAPVVSRLARLAWVQGDPSGAVVLSTEALDLSEKLALRSHDAAQYWLQLGHFQFVTGDLTSAIEALDQALVIAPGHVGATEQLALVHASTGNTAEAEALYQALLTSAPAADIHGAYADLLTAQGDQANAEIHEQLGLELARTAIDRYPAERRHLARFFLRRDPPQAVELAQADLAERHDIGAHDTLAWALFHAGRYDEAAKTIPAALTEGTQDASLLYHAAAIAAATGDHLTATRHLQHALALNPQFDPIEGPAAAALLAELTSLQDDEPAQVSRTTVQNVSLIRSIC